MPTTTEKQLDWAKLLETALTAPGDLRGIYSRFYEYSYLNQLLLMMQGAREPVATYKRWQTLGRQVLKGSKAFEIVRPIQVKREDDDGGVVMFTRFKPVKCLFTYSQTEGDELPPAPDPPEWSLKRAEENLSIYRVPFEHTNGNVQGFSYHRAYAVNPMAVYPFKTTMHELGHIVLGHTTPNALDDYHEHRGIREFQAEAVAHLVTNELGVLEDDAASVSRGYIQSWLQHDTPPEHAIRQVFPATDAILKAGRLAVEGGEDG